MYSALIPDSARLRLQAWKAHLMSSASSSQLVFQPIHSCPTPSAFTGHWHGGCAWYRQHHLLYRARCQHQRHHDQPGLQRAVHLLCRQASRRSGSCAGAEPPLCGVHQCRARQQGVRAVVKWCLTGMFYSRQTKGKLVRAEGMKEGIGSGGHRGLLRAGSRGPGHGEHQGRERNHDGCPGQGQRKHQGHRTGAACHTLKVSASMCTALGNSAKGLMLKTAFHSKSDMRVQTWTCTSHTTSNRRVCQAPAQLTLALSTHLQYFIMDNLPDGDLASWPSAPQASLSSIPLNAKAEAVGCL
eukprot:1156449-Pelagomonas_calceolata.AAC.7